MKPHGSQQNGGRGAARHRQHKHRYYGAAYAGIVAGFGSRQSLDGPFAEFLRRLAGATGKIVSHKRGDIFPDPRNCAHKYTDQSGSNNVFPVNEQISDAGQHPANLQNFPAPLGLDRGLDNLGHAVYAHQRRYHRNPAVQINRSIGKAGIGLDGFHSNHRQKQSQKAGDPALERIFRCRQVAANQNTEQRQPEKLKGLETKSNLSQIRREKGHEKKSNGGSQK